MSEVIEHELHQLNGKAVDVVRPGYGTQSDAWMGIIFTDGVSYPLRFQFKHVGGSILFQSDDVIKVEHRNTPERSTVTKVVIRLKGPEQYQSHPVHA